MAGGNKTVRRILAGVVLCLWGLAAAGEPREVHKLGVEALEAGRWADAERFFREAIAERSDERVGGLLGRRYLPHYYLGVALAEQGDCRGALKAWSESARQGKIEKADDLAADLRRRRGGCQEHLRQVDELKAEVEDLLAQAESSRKTLATFATKPELAPVWSRAVQGAGEPSFAARQGLAEERLAAARRQLQSGFEQADLEVFGQARSLADEALKVLRTAINDARRELGELSAATAEALERLEEEAASAEGLVRSIADLRPYPPELGRRAAAVERVLGTIERTEDGARADELERLSGDLAAEVERLRIATRRPPRTLVNAVEAFLGGAYQEVLDLLAEDRWRDLRSRIHVSLLRAASRHALFVLGGGEDLELLDQAKSDAVECYELAPELELLPRYFSPRFAEFYGEAHRPPEPEPEEADEPVAEGDEPVAEGDEPEPEDPESGAPPPSPWEGGEGGLAEGGQGG